MTVRSNLEWRIARNLNTMLLQTFRNHFICLPFDSFLFAEHIVLSVFIQQEQKETQQSSSKWNCKCIYNQRPLKTWKFIIVSIHWNLSEKKKCTKQNDWYVARKINSTWYNKNSSSHWALVIIIFRKFSAQEENKTFL